MRCFRWFVLLQGLLFGGIVLQLEVHAAVKVPAIGVFQVVQDANSSGETVSELSANEWIQLQRRTKDPTTKLYALLGSRAFSEAVRDARAFLGKYPRNLDGLIVLSIALAMTEQYQLAAYYASMIDKYYPSQSIAANLQGLAVLRSARGDISDFYKAADLFRHAIERSDTEIAAALNLGHLYLEIGNAAAALSAFQMARKRCQNCTAATDGVATALLRKGQYRQAKEVLLAVINRNPEDFDAHYRLALVAINGERDFSMAKRHLEIVLESRGETQLDLRRRANVLMRRVETKLD